MCLSGVFDNQPLVHGIVGQIGAVEIQGPGVDLATGSPVSGGPMLIDTGAQVSVIDSNLALDLGLPETAAPTPIVGVGGSQEARQFTGLLHLPAWNITLATTFLSLPLQENHRILALIGMDVLINLIFTLDGPKGMISLSFPDKSKTD